MRVAVLGATGSVGRAILQLLDERTFPAKEVIALGSAASVGRQVSMGDTVLTVQEGEKFDFSCVDFVFAATHAEVAKRLLPRAVAAGARVVDKSSAFRMNADVPLVVPEVNRHLLTASPQLVASPNCVVIPLVLALAPLHREAGLKRLLLSTYQSVSGVGKKGMDELYGQTRAILMTDPAIPKVFSQPIAFNVIPQIGDINSQGWTDEEIKIQEETQKILGGIEVEQPSTLKTPIGIAVTAVRVPVFIGHSFSVFAEFETPLSEKAARHLLSDAPGLNAFARQGKGMTPLEVIGEDEAFVSRLRVDLSVPHGLCFWVTCDNLRKGAALNAMQIAEELCGFSS